MSTEHPSDPGHLDIDTISAALDGEATEAEAAHLDGCAACEARVALLRSVQLLVAVPPDPVAPTVRDTAIATALAAADEGADGEPAGSTARSADEPAHVSVLRTRQRRRRVQAGPWLGVAALLLLAVLAVPLLGGLVGESDDGDSATSATAGGNEDTMAMTAPEDDPVDVGDLGDLDPGADLRGVVDDALATRPAPMGADATESEEDAADERSSSGEAVPGPSPAATGGADDGDTGPSPPVQERQSAAAGRPTREVAAECLASVRSELGDLGALLLVGTATVDGEPALVLGFDAPAARRPTVLVVLVAVEGCDLVTFQSYARG